jgi:hypothetical protein
METILIKFLIWIAWQMRTFPEWTEPVIIMVSFLSFCMSLVFFIFFSFPRHFSEVVGKICSNGKEIKRRVGLIIICFLSSLIFLAITFILHISTFFDRASYVIYH